MKVVVVIIIVIAIGVAVIVIPKEPITKEGQNVTTTPQATSTIQFSPFTATFEIHTNGTKRIFTDPRYHNLSNSVFLSASDPSVINVQVSGTTWDDFFKTLPMKLTPECLTTGTGQTFCSSKTSELKFMINNIDDPSALDKEIKAGDHLKVIYSPSS